MKFSAADLQQIRADATFCSSLHYLEETTSTNAVLKQMALEGAGEGAVVLAARQTEGRGRLGRSFFSPEGGLYMSVLFRPTVSVQNPLMLTAAAAVAVSRAIEKVYSLETKIKWVNDIYVEGKKVCGILAEGQIDPQKPTEPAVILGIGINICAPKEGFPSEIADRAGALTKQFEPNLKQVSRLIGEMLNNLYEYYLQLDKKAFLNDYRERSMLTGRTVQYQKNGRTFTAEVVGIDDEARLVVLESGCETALFAGEVQLSILTERVNPNDDKRQG